MQDENFDIVRDIIEKRAKNNWTDTPVAYQDVPYKVQKNVSYIGLNILFGESENAGLNSVNNPEAPVRENGVLMIACYTAVNIGSGEVLRIAGKIRSLYQNTQENGLYFYAGSTTRVGEDGDFLRYDVEIPFFYQ